MFSNRRAILSLVAHGRISAAEAERLIAVCSGDREAWWMLAGCALCAGLIQFHALCGIQPHTVGAMTQLLRAAIVGSTRELHYVISHIATLLGGNQ